MSGWTVAIPCNRAEAEALSGEVPALDTLADPPVITSHEIDEDSDRWEIVAYFEQQPDADTLATLRGLIPSAARMRIKAAPLPDADWVTLSQQGLEPVCAGRFYVHTSDNRGTVPANNIALRIDAGLAFGTGGHDTTAGCLAMIDRLARRGVAARRIADIGTGTGLLAFAAQHLWPAARIVASDIDPVSVATAADNARLNARPLGHGPGRIALAAAAGTDHPAIRAGAPYDLVIANILAGPLITLAPDLVSATAPGGHLVLAGLIARQMEAVSAAYTALGCRRVAQGGSADWPCLVFVKRRRFGHRRPERARHRADPADASFGSW